MNIPYLKYRVMTWILEKLGILEYLRTYATSQIDTRLPETLQEVIDASDLSRRLYSFQMQLEGEMKTGDALATSTNTSFRKLLARLSNIDELLAKHREEVEILRRKLSDMTDAFHYIQSAIVDRSPIVPCPKCGQPTRTQRRAYSMTEERVDSDNGAVHECVDQTRRS